MGNNLNQIKDRVVNFYNNAMDMPNIEDRLCDFLCKELMNDYVDKGIKNFNDWLIYYSTDENDFEDVVKQIESYYYKALKQDLAAITLEEKVLVYNALALYCVEMDVFDRPNGQLFNTVIITFIEIIRHYNLFLKGFISMKGEVLISNRAKSQFFSVWDNGDSYKKEIPITLFSIKD